MATIQSTPNPSDLHAGTLTLPDEEQNDALFHVLYEWVEYAEKPEASESTRYWAPFAAELMEGFPCRVYGAPDDPHVFTYTDREKLAALVRHELMLTLDGGLDGRLELACACISVLRDLGEPVDMSTLYNGIECGCGACALAAKEREAMYRQYGIEDDAD